MKHLLEVYVAQFKIKIIEQLQYRVALAIWLIEIALTPIIAIVVWSAVAAERGGSIKGYTPSTLAAYFIVAMLVNYFTQTWVFWEFDGRVQQGLLSPLLLRPIHPIHADIAQNIAYKLLMLFVIVPITLLLILLFHPAFEITWLTGIALVFAFLLAFLLRFLIEWALALLAFWTTSVVILNQLYIVALLFLSGQLVPLNFFPPLVQQAANILPFRWMIAFPAQLCVSHLQTSEVLTGLGMQCLWLAISTCLLILLWRTGIRRYSAVGA